MLCDALPLDLYSCYVTSMLLVTNRTFTRFTPLASFEPRPDSKPAYLPSTCSEPACGRGLVLADMLDELPAELVDHEEWRCPCEKHTRVMLDVPGVVA